MPNYNTELFSPPAPIASVTVRNPSTNETISDVPLLIDSGADATLLPQSIVDSLGITIDKDQNAGYELLGFDGNKGFVA
jgi:hypothetical protein